MKRINPVFLHGVKSRMRGVRAPVLMSIYFVILMAIFIISYASMVGSSYYTVSRPRPEGTEMLTVLFSLLVVMIFVMVVLMAPALNAGNIAAEREKQTLDLLLSSKLLAIQIVTGKVFSNLAFMVFLLILTLPMFAVIYLFGSIMVADILKTVLFMVVSAYGCASVATFFSSLVKKTSIATILSYVALLLFVVLTAVIGAYLYSRHIMLANYSYDDGYVPIGWRINPIFAIIELLVGAESNFSGGNNLMMELPEGIRFSFVFDSTCFMLIFSILLNIASAILIKPVKKLQLRP